MEILSPKLKDPQLIGNFSHKISINLGLSNFGMYVPILVRHNFSNFRRNNFRGE